MFSTPKNSPWGMVEACDTLYPGVFMVSIEGHGGTMVSEHIAAILSPAAQKSGFKLGGYICFEQNTHELVVQRELLDKKLWAIPGRVRDKAAFEENMNNILRRHNPDYWRSRQKGLEQAQRRHNAPARQTAAPAYDAR